MKDDAQPTGNNHDAPDAMAELSPLKRQLLALLMKNEGVGVEPRQAIERRAQTNNCPLSFAQNRVWFFHLMEPENPFYNMAGGVHLKGQLDVSALERSLNEVVRRHEILRTVFAEIDKQPVQVITDAGSLPLARHDLRGLPETEREAAMKSMINDMSRRPFELRRGPLIRAALLHLEPDEHALLLTKHHIISDGWSIGILIKEVAALYAAFVNDQPSPLPALPVQYADYAVWQRQWLRGEVLEEQLGYWKRQLGGRLPVLELPTDRSRPPVQSYRGATEHFTVDAEVAEQLRELSRREGVTLFMMLLAAFQTLLYRYTGKEDVIVGTPIANRTRREVEGLIGFFVNTLVIRTDATGNPKFREMMQRVKEACLGAYAHQDVPFEKLVEELRPERDMSRAPLFQVLFALQNTPIPTVELPGVVLSELHIDNGTAKFDIELAMEEAGDEIRAHFNYNIDLFNASTALQMIEHLKQLLAEVAANPEQCVLDFDFSWTGHKKEARPSDNAPDTDQFVFEL